MTVEKPKTQENKRKRTEIALSAHINKIILLE